MKGFTYTQAAIPTQYKGVDFRSRLEARWAAFFDLVGWEWEYEPVDLPGWTPDFRVLIHYPSTNRDHPAMDRPALVEVKPLRAIRGLERHLHRGADIMSDSQRDECRIFLLGESPEYIWWRSVGNPTITQLTMSVPESVWRQAGNATRTRYRRAA